VTTARGRLSFIGEHHICWATRAPMRTVRKGGSFFAPPHYKMRRNSQAAVRMGPTDQEGFFTLAAEPAPFSSAMLLFFASIADNARLLRKKNSGKGVRLDSTRFRDEDYLGKDG